MNKTLFEIHRLILYFLLLFLMFSAGTVDAQNIETQINVEGTGTIIQKKIHLAKDSAIDDCLRRAVQQVVGTLISPELFTENYQLLYDSIYAKAAKYVKSYKILDEKKEDILYRIKLSVKIDLDSLKNDLTEISPQLIRKQELKVIVLIKNNSANYDKSSDYWTVISDPEAIVGQKFTENGLYVINTKAIKRNSSHKLILRAIEGNNQTSAALGLEHNAEFVITGILTAKEAGVTLEENLKYYTANILVRVVDTKTASILITKHEQVTILHSDEETGKKEAIKKVSDMISDYLISQFLFEDQADQEGENDQINNELEEITNYDF